jgi:hypothetical protein
MVWSGFLVMTLAGFPGLPRGRLVECCFDER